MNLLNLSRGQMRVKLKLVEWYHLYSGFQPLVHTQLGSPSSAPLDVPSPSESALHKSVVHT